MTSAVSSASGTASPFTQGLDYKAVHLMPHAKEHPVLEGKIFPDSDDSDHGDNTDYDPVHCLFCSTISDSVESNLSHMHKSHGMTIPSPHQLTVDPATLLNYLNLVISVYHECLACGTQRRNTQAIRQHMLGKGHCAFDISDVNSEYRDFWAFDGDAAKVKVDGDSVTLPSGRVVMSRSIRLTQPRQRSSVPDDVSLSLPDAIPSDTPALNVSPTDASASRPSAQPILSEKQSLTKQDLRALNLSKQIDSLRSTDRLALAHLPASEQRSILASQDKQLQKARRQERDAQARLQRKNNQTMMQHFVSDVPGPKLG